MAAAPANHRVWGGGGDRPTLLYSGGASRGPPGTTISNLEDQLNTLRAFNNETDMSAINFDAQDLEEIPSGPCAPLA